MIPTDPTLYEQIGSDFVTRAITVFYQRAFQDPIIGHFFFHHDIDHITRQQILFATSMLGGPKQYSGKSLAEAHSQLDLRGPHFDRRQVLMGEVLAELGLDSDLAARWLQLEQKLRPLIVKG